MKKFSISTLVVFALFSSKCYSTVRYDVVNNSTRDITFEMKGGGNSTLSPGYQTWFSYDHKELRYEQHFSCKKVGTELHCGTLFPDELFTIIYSSNCEVINGRLNNSIICK
jgi:hypothetical protein